MPRFGLPVLVRWRCAGVVPVVLQSDVSAVTAILDIATLLLWSSAVTVIVCRTTAVEEVMPASLFEMIEPPGSGDAR